MKAADAGEQIQPPHCAHRNCGLSSQMADRFYVVPIRVQHKRGVVLLVIPRAKARSPVALAASGQCRPIKSIYLRSARRTKGNVRPWCQRLANSNVEVPGGVFPCRFNSGPEDHKVTYLFAYLVLQGRKCGAIEGLARRKVGNVDSCMVNHRHLLAALATFQQFPFFACPGGQKPPEP